MMCPGKEFINSQGRISERPGAAKQRKLLKDEGVDFVKDKIDLKEYGWHGLSTKHLPKQETLF